MGVSKHLIADDQLALAVELLSHDAVDTSAIEGEKLDHASVQASIQRNLGLKPSVQHARPLEAGIANMMTHLYQTLQEPLSEQVLFEWHTHLFKGTVSLDTLGGYRRFSEPMQIVSGPDYKRKIHFEAPPSSRVPTEMAKLLEWYEQTGPDTQASLPPITRAGVLHLWFESIHPFEDGNGRIGRALAEKALAQSLETPALTALAITIARRRKEYYEQLQRANQTLEINDWLLWFASVAIEAQKRTQLWVELFVEKSKLLHRLAGQLNPRQEKLLLKLFKSGPDGFIGGFSANNAMSITGASTATVRRDLGDLVKKEALQRTGEKKGARYHLTCLPKPIEQVSIEQIT